MRYIFSPYIEHIFLTHKISIKQCIYINILDSALLVNSIHCIPSTSIHPYVQGSRRLVSGLLDVKQSGSDSCYTMDRGDYRWVDGSPLVFTKWYTQMDFSFYHVRSAQGLAEADAMTQLFHAPNALSLFFAPTLIAEFTLKSLPTT